MYCTWNKYKRSEKCRNERAKWSLISCTYLLVYTRTHLQFPKIILTTQIYHLLTVNYYLYYTFKNECVNSLNWQTNVFAFLLLFNFFRFDMLNGRRISALSLSLFFCYHLVNALYLSKLFPLKNVGLEEEKVN